MKKLLLYILCLFAWPALAQLADSTSLDEVEITSQRFNQYKTGFHYSKIDSAQLALFPAANLSQLLQAFTPVHIRTYGPTGIASAAFRGTGAEHTAVLWNGFNIANSMLGQFDFSLLPTLAVDEIQVQHGGNGALFGSGAIGGTIQLENTPRFNTGMRGLIGTTIGSFGLAQPLAQISYGSANQYVKANYQHRVVRNNFPFMHEGISYTQQHARLSNNALTASHFWKPRKNQLLKTNVMLLENNRQLPPTFQRNLSRATQLDQSFRLGSEWNLHSGEYMFAVRSGLFGERLKFQDPLSQIYSTNDILNWITEVQLQRQWKQKWNLSTGANYTFTQANSAGYRLSNATQQRAALFYALQYKSKSIIITQSTRIEKQDDLTAPIIPLLGVEYRIFKGWMLAGNASRGYRMPALNERFWFPGGNPNLLAEDSYGGDIGLGHVGHIGNFCWQAKALYFYRHISNRIVWLPGSQFPVATNIREMQTQGLETQWKLALLINKNWNINYTGQFNFTHAINLRAISANDNAVGKQMILVPRIGQQHFATIQYKQYQLSTIAQYTGMRFTSSDNSAALNDFQTIDMVMSRAISHNKHRLSLQIGVYNMLNTQYMIMPEMPMYGRTFQFTCIYQIHHPNKQ